MSPGAPDRDPLLGERVARLLEDARGDRPAATGRLLSLLEDGGEAARSVARIAFPLGGRAHTVGITGPPGAGKSTLTGRLIAALHGRAERVAVLAVDPSSPLSGGAILGDRVRMEHVRDGSVFIRSMASRGHHGGLALAAPAAVHLLDAAGFDWILVETVGVGQGELEVCAVADTTVLVVNPGWGDEVQAAKAGILEVADVFVVNKADRPGADQVQLELEAMLATGPATPWTPPVVRSVATSADGCADVLAAIDRHRAWLREEADLASLRAARHWDEVAAAVFQAMRDRAVASLTSAAAARIRSEVGARALDPLTAAAILVEGERSPAAPA